MTLKELELAFHKLTVMRAHIETQKEIYDEMTDIYAKTRRQAHIDYCQAELDDFLNTEIGEVLVIF